MARVGATGATFALLLLPQTTCRSWKLRVGPAHFLAVEAPVCKLMGVEGGLDVLVSSWHKGRVGSFRSEPNILCC